MENLIGDKSTNRVNRGHLFVSEGKLALFGGHFPHNLIDLVIFELVKDAV